MKRRVVPLCLGAACLSAALCLAGCDFFGAAAFDSDTIYVAGDIVGAAQFVFGPGAAARGDYAGFNAVLVKYDGTGAAQWARSTVDADDESRFYAAAVDAAGNVYAAGYIRGNGIFSFGPDADVIGNLPGDWNAVLVKYNAGGTAQWARSVTAASNESEYRAIAADASGNALCAGRILGTDECVFVAGAAVSGIDAGYNGVVVKNLNE